MKFTIRLFLLVASSCGVSSAAISLGDNAPGALRRRAFEYGVAFITPDKVDRGGINNFGFGYRLSF